MVPIRKSRIKDIARLANVSIGTVDRVLHHRGRVSPKTMQKVSEIAKQSNYKPNILARALVINKKYTIGLFIPNPNGNEYWEQAFKDNYKLISKFEQQGLNIELYFYSAENKKSFKETGQKILKSQPNAIIMASLFLNEGLSFYKQCCSLSIPVIIFDTTIPYLEPLSFIGIDSFQSGRVAAELLTLTDHKRGKFAILHFDQELVDAPQMLEREKGFISYLKEEYPDREYIVRVLNNKQHYYQNVIKEILEKDKISCIFVSTAQVYRIGEYLQQNKIPDKIVIGYDLTSKNIQLLNNGYISFLINENPRLQVEKSLNTISNYLLYGEPINSKILFPIEIITRSNLNSHIYKSSAVNQIAETV
jgi:LacI family transcriptional regulator